MTRNLVLLVGLTIAVATGPWHAARANEPGQVVMVDTSQRVWRVPYQYLSIRPSAGERRAGAAGALVPLRLLDAGRTPSLIPGHMAPNLTPQEPGRPPPGPHEYLVMAAMVLPLGAPGSPPRPSMRLENILFAGTDRYAFTQRWGMIEVTPLPGQPANFDGYFGTQRWPDGSTVTSLLSCPREGHPTLQHNPAGAICLGSVAIRGLNVVYELWMPMRQMEHAMDAIGTSARLLAEWARNDDTSTGGRQVRP